MKRDQPKKSQDCYDEKLKKLYDIVSIGKEDIATCAAVKTITPMDCLREVRSQAVFKMSYLFQESLNCQSEKKPVENPRLG